MSLTENMIETANLNILASKQKQSIASKRSLDDDNKNRSIPIHINIDFGKIKKYRRDLRNVTKSIYTEIPYDNSALPKERFPTNYAVPHHLLKEFKAMFPRKDNTKGKIGLVPDELVRFPFPFHELYRSLSELSACSSGFI